MIAALVWLGAVGCRSAGPPPLSVATSDGDASLPVVIAIHGLGDRPESLVALVERCALPVRVVAPRGPIPHHDGYSWFDVRFGDGGTSFDTAQIAASADQIGALISQMAREGVHDPVVTGFSQGGVLSFVLATRHPDALSRAIPISGALPEALLPAGPPPAGAPPIRAVHGEADRVLPVAGAEASVSRLEQLGWDAALTTFPATDHTVSSPMLAAVCSEIAAALRR